MKIPVRAALVFTMLIGAMYAAARVLTSTRDFAVGAAVVVVGAIGYGLLGWIEQR